MRAPSIASGVVQFRSLLFRGVTLFFEFILEIFEQALFLGQEPPLPQGPQYTPFCVLIPVKLCFSCPPVTIGPLSLSGVHISVDFFLLITESFYNRRLPAVHRAALFPLSQPKAFSLSHLSLSLVVQNVDRSPRTTSRFPLEKLVASLFPLQRDFSSCRSISPS